MLFCKAAWTAQGPSWLVGSLTSVPPFPTPFRIHLCEIMTHWSAEGHGTGGLSRNPLLQGRLHSSQIKMDSGSTLGTAGPLGKILLSLFSI